MTYTKTLLDHERDMYAFLDRLREKPVSNWAWLRKPRGVHIVVVGRKKPWDSHYPIRFVISSRGRTGASDRLALQNIMRRKRTFLMHQDWLDRF